MWFRLMMVAFVFNGLCTFGLRILADRKLAAEFTPGYLAFWYLAGALFIFAIYLRGGRGIKRADLLVGTGLGFFSACGQTALGLALSKGLPGHVVFPVTLAGGLFIVVAAGIFLSKNRSESRASWELRSGSFPLFC